MGRKGQSSMHNVCDYVCLCAHTQICKDGEDLPSSDMYQEKSIPESVQVKLGDKDALNTIYLASNNF